MKSRIQLYFTNWGVYIFLSIVVISIIVASTMLISYLREQETKSIQIFAEAQKLLNKENTSDPEVQLLLLNILNSNENIPVIVVDKTSQPVFTKNIPEKVKRDTSQMSQLLVEMKSSYPPIKIDLPGSQDQYIYYTNSQLLRNLQYYPLILALIIAAYIAFSFWFIGAVRKSSEGFLWAGLAKETAHQIGTPLSSMIGWIEILRMENENSTGVQEIEKDIQRLKIISERFSKIGSVPELRDLNLKETVVHNYEYLKGRISTKVHFTLEVPPTDILLPHSRILLSWVIENIVKNAVDAMKGQGVLKISLREKEHTVEIDIKDNGSGMTKRQARKVFKPGFSTKERGWGLGLSLARRVINEYHHGELLIANTVVGKGTTFRMILRKHIDIS